MLRIICCVVRMYVKRRLWGRQTRTESKIFECTVGEKQRK